MSTVGQARTAEEIKKDWETNPRWKGITRNYTAEDVEALQGTVVEENTLARRGAEILFDAIHEEGDGYINALGALTGNQAVQQVRAGLKAVYLSGWQVAGDANLASQTYPDQSLYPANSVPQIVRRINNALLRADEVARIEDDTAVDNWLLPIVADAEAGFGGALNVFELQKAMIQAGAAGTHWEDQLASEKKCGHLGGKVLIPTQQHIRAVVGTVGGRCSEHADRDRCPHRRRGRDAHYLGRRRAGPEVHYGRPHRGGLLPRSEWDRAVYRARQVLRPLRGSHLDGDRHTRPGVGQEIRRWCPRGVPRPAAGLQLLTVVQLVLAPGGGRDREVPERTGQDGLQVPVHHPGWFPRTELLHVRPGLRLRTRADDSLCGPAEPRVRSCQGAWIHRRQAPARGRCRVLRPRCHNGGPQLLHGCSEGLHRGRPVPLGQSAPGSRLGTPCA